MGAEPPTRIRGGAVLGGIGGSRPAEIGPVTEYVLRRAPCRVLRDRAGHRRVAPHQGRIARHRARGVDRPRGLAADPRVAERRGD